MCLHSRLDSRSRRILGLGNICLFTGLSISLWGTSFALRHPAVFNGLRFGLLLLAICLNFWALRSAGRANKDRT